MKNVLLYIRVVVVVVALVLLGWQAGLITQTTDAHTRKVNSLRFETVKANRFLEGPKTQGEASDAAYFAIRKLEDQYKAKVITHTVNILVIAMGTTIAMYALKEV